MPDTVIFNLDLNEYIWRTDDSEDLIVRTWTPTIRNVIPPLFSQKYIAYWLFHYLNIFANREYSAVLIYKGGSVISRLLIVPKYYKWPFMGKADVQLTYVITGEHHRGEGLAQILINNALNSLKGTGVDKVWYVTNTYNDASIKLCQKMGFSQVGQGIRKRICNIGVYKLTLLKEE